MSLLTSQNSYIHTSYMLYSEIICTLLREQSHWMKQETSSILPMMEALTTSEMTEWALTLCTWYHYTNHLLLWTLLLMQQDDIPVTCFFCEISQLFLFTLPFLLLPFFIRHFYSFLCTPFIWPGTKCLFQLHATFIHKTRARMCALSLELFGL